MDVAEKNSSRLEETRRKFRNFARRKLEWTEYSRGILDRTEAEVKELLEEWKKTRIPESTELRELKRKFYGLGFEKSEIEIANNLSKKIQKEKRERKKVAGRFYDTFFDAPDETLYRADLYKAYNRALEELQAYFETRTSNGFAGEVEWTRGEYPPGWDPWKAVGVKRSNGKFFIFPPIPELADARYGDYVEISATDTGYTASLRR